MEKGGETEAWSLRGQAIVETTTVLYLSARKLPLQKPVPNSSTHNCSNRKTFQKQTKNRAKETRRNNFCRPEIEARILCVLFIASLRIVVKYLRV